MFIHTDIPEAPWYVVEADDKRRARLNMIAHLLASVPYVDVRRPPLSLPRRPPPKGYERTPREMQTYVPNHVATLAQAMPGSRRTDRRGSRPRRVHRRSATVAATI